MSEAKARKNDPETSCEAAESVNVPRDRRAVLWALHKLHFASDEDIYSELLQSVFTHEPQHYGTAQSIRSRRAELMRDGYIDQATNYVGTPAYGKTSCNRRCRIYVLTDKGKKLAFKLFC